MKQAFVDGWKHQPWTFRGPFWQIALHPDRAWLSPQLARLERGALNRLLPHVSLKAGGYGVLVVVVVVVDEGREKSFWKIAVGHCGSGNCFEKKLSESLMSAKHPS